MMRKMRKTKEDKREVNEHVEDVIDNKLKKDYDQVIKGLFSRCVAQ